MKIFLIFFLISSSLFAKDQIDEKIKNMSLDEKIGQIFVGFFYGEDLDDRVKNLIEKTKLGNFILFDSIILGWIYTRTDVETIHS